MRLARVLFACLLLWPLPAGADEPRRYRLDYGAPASCPKEEEFVAAVRVRAAAAERVMSGAPGVSARVTLTVEGADAHGAIAVQGPAGSIERAVDAPDCAQVARALALILALAIEPDATPPPSAADVQEPPNTNTHAEPIATSSSTSLEIQDRKSAQPPGASPWFGVGANVGLSGGVAPNPALQEGFFLEFGRGHARGLLANVRLAAIHAHGSEPADSGTADFDLLALRASSCPYRLTNESPALDACVSFDFGRLQARGSNTLSPETGSASWFGPGVFFRATVRALPALLIQLELGALTPLAHDRFYFGPTETVHRIPALSGYGGLNLVLGG